MTVDRYPCGPKRLPTCIRAPIHWAFGWVFGPCCRAHDGEYEADGTVRAGADDRFRECCFCEAAKRTCARCWKFVAHVFIALVDLLGWTSKKPRRWPWQKLRDRL